MSVNFMPTLNGYSGQGAFKFWCQTVLPLVYDDSLSYYELLCKVVKYLNNTISDINNVIDNVEELNNAYEQLQEYVNNYFDNLDVTEEINNKLDEMATDGSLTALISPFIPDIVTDWLAEHITPTTPAIDDTLSVSGAGADSKTVGDYFNLKTLIDKGTINSSIDMDELLDSGYYFKGGNVTFENGVNSNAARIIVFKTFGVTSAIVQVWFDTALYNLYYRIKRSSDFNWSAYRKVNTNYSYNFTKRDTFEMGGISVGNGSLLNNNNYAYMRSPLVYKCGYDDNIRVYCEGTSAAFFIFYYDSTGAFISEQHLSSSSIKLTIPETAKYYKLQIRRENSTKEKIYFRIESEKEIVACYNFNILSTHETDSLSFCYNVSFDANTSGRLLLPYNYDIEGEKCPLIVFAHGSGSMTRWSSQIGAFSSGTYKPYLDYLTHEGYAVFDCYPWGDKQNIPSSTFSPVGVATCYQSYLQGIEYVCSRFNVDINKVVLLCKSQGGHFAHWAMFNANVFKAIALFAPASGLARYNILYNANCREAFTKYCNLNYSEVEEISHFISSGSYTDTDTKAFIDNNKYTFAQLQPYVKGICNGNWEDYFDDFTQPATTIVPEWLQEYTPATIPTGGAAIQVWARHEDYVKVADIPTKFWCAFDDNSVSAYNVYAVYRWLQNGGSDTDFRTLANNTGGHHAMDTDANAQKATVTARNGETYTNIPVAYIEVNDFFSSKLGCFTKTPIS